MEQKEILFENLEHSDLYIDCVYKGGKTGNAGDDPLIKLIPRCEASGGFRKKLREDGSGKYAYVVLYTTMEELEWPDYLDEETGIFRYYGDNRAPGRALTDTTKKGNLILENAFALLNEGANLEDIPPFFVFKKTGIGRDVQFLGLAVPGNPNLSPDRDLVAFWRTMKDKRFQNYEAHFTILDTGDKPITREWLNALIYNHENSLQYAPSAWKQFIAKGRNGIKALKSPRIVTIPSKYDQLQCDIEGNRCLEIMRKHYENTPAGFEACAANIVSMMDSNFINFVLTRPWRDGGRDATGQYIINQNSKVNAPLKIDCALEAKCYASNNSVGVREMSRLISRIRYRQFGIMVTTSYVNSQAYGEVVEDGHPILIITASDIAGILRRNGIDSSNIEIYLQSIDENNAFYNKLSLKKTRHTSAGFSNAAISEYFDDDL